jgi:hypothetical protein
MSEQPTSPYSRLYEEAESARPSDTPDPADELCPLYHALRRSDVRYSGEESIGIGGMKEVFRVYDERTERQVALARPKESVAPGRYDAFLREAHITARLEHPNIINLFDMGIDDQQRPFFTMELKRGQSLRGILSGLRSGKHAGGYPREQRLSIFLRVCEAVAYAHSRHVLHLDIKPENIQVGPFGEVQVCDWGMGEIERGESEEHLSEVLLDPDLYGGQLEPGVKGTPGYIAPEQENPKAAKSVRNDIFSLGCLLYELATLKKPAARSEHPPESHAVAAIATKACAPDPGDRYADVEAMRADVSRHLTGYSAGAEQAGFQSGSKVLVQHPGPEKRAEEMVPFRIPVDQPFLCEAFEGFGHRRWLANSRGREKRFGGGLCAARFRETPKHPNLPGCEQVDDARIGLALGLVNSLHAQAHLTRSDLASGVRHIPDLCAQLLHIARNVVRMFEYFIKGHRAHRATTGLESLVQVRRVVRPVDRPH